MCLIFTTLLLCLLGTGIYRRYALSSKILDIPNERSAHQMPIPRGGGVVFVTIFLSIAIVYQFFPLHIIIAMFGIGLLGYLDDKYSLSPWLRLFCQVVCVTLMLWCLQGVPAIHVGPWVLNFNIWTNWLGIIYLLWILNLYNFMDGINGIAGFEALCVALGMMTISFNLGDMETFQAMTVLVAVMIGFLYWNFPKAKIFMGDVGSGFLGILFGIWSLQSTLHHPDLFWSWLILLGVFIVDATMTIFWRILQGESLHIAHSNHAYQQAARRFRSHVKVTLTVVGINVFWLWPWAFVVGAGWVAGWIGLMCSYIPLMVLRYFLKTHISQR